MSDGYIQVAPDSTGKRVDNSPIVLLAGTVVIESDGSSTTLAVDTIVYRQRTVIADASDAGASAAVQQIKAGSADYALLVMTRGRAVNDTHELLFLMLQEIKQLNAHMQTMVVGE